MFRKSILFTFGIIAFYFSSSAQVRTMGNTLNNSGHLDGYLFFAPLNSKTTFMIDKCGREINRWVSNYFPGVCVKVLPDGGILRTGSTQKNWFGQGIGGIIERYDWDGNLIWSWKMMDSMESMHHDVTLLNNGNILAVAWERVSKEDLQDAGRNPSKLPNSLWSEKIIEIKPIGTDSAEIVWEWHAMDHIIQNYDNSKPNFGSPSQNPQRFDINFVKGNNNGEDWFHINSIDYNPELDQIVLSAHTLGEIYIIDHGTTSIQAAGHTGGKQGKGGDILYRWGNPQAYGIGGTDDQVFFKQHHAHWIPKGFTNEGMIMVFNNGNGRIGGNYSTVELINTPVDNSGAYSLTSGQKFGPMNSYIAYQSNPDPYLFYADFVSGAYSMKNGHVMITDGPKGTVFEIDDSQTTLWKYTSPINSTGALTQGTNPTGNPVFRFEYIPEDFKGLEGKDLTPGVELEKNPKPFTQCVTQQQNNVIENQISDLVTVYPNPTNGILHFSKMATEATIYNLAGTVCLTVNNTEKTDIGYLKAGIYHVIITSNGLQSHQRIVIQK